MRIPAALFSLFLVPSALLAVEELPVKITETEKPEPDRNPPPGWQIRILSQAEIPFTKQLSNNRTVKVFTTPFELVPDNEGPNVYSFTQPGYKPSDKRAQKDTLEGVLQECLQNIDKLQSRLDKAIKELEATIPPQVTFPKPEPKAEAPKPSPAPSDAKAANVTLPNLAPR